MSSIERPSSSRLSELTVLSEGTIDVLGRLPYSSNHVFLVNVTADAGALQAVYKPQRGERPLWDFPSGTLGLREVAAYIFSEAGGFDIVPPTVWRDDAPLGPGSLQTFVDHDPQRHYFTLLEVRRDELVRFATFDVVINNADRKAGHVIETLDGTRLWGIDHGLSFNVEPKLRTVIWDFAGGSLPEEERARLERTIESLEPETETVAALDALLDPAEVGEARTRAEALLARGRLPEPQGPFDMPWPLV